MEMEAQILRRTLREERRQQSPHTIEEVEAVHVVEARAPAEVDENEARALADIVEATAPINADTTTGAVIAIGAPSGIPVIPADVNIGSSILLQPRDVAPLVRGGGTIVPDEANANADANNDTNIDTNNVDANADVDATTTETTEQELNMHPLSLQLVGDVLAASAAVFASGVANLGHKVAEALPGIRASAVETVEVVRETAPQVAAQVAEVAELASEAVTDVAVTAKHNAEEALHAASAQLGVVAERTQEALHTASARTQEALHTASARVSDVAGTVKNKTEGALHTAEGALHTASSRAKDVAGTVKNKTEGALHPLADQLSTAWQTTTDRIESTAASLKAPSSTKGSEHVQTREEAHRTVPLYRTDDEVARDEQSLTHRVGEMVHNIMSRASETTTKAVDAVSDRVAPVASAVRDTTATADETQPLLGETATSTTETEEITQVGKDITTAALPPVPPPRASKRDTAQPVVADVAAASAFHRFPSPRTSQQPDANVESGNIANAEVLVVPLGVVKTPRSSPRVAAGQPTVLPVSDVPTVPVEPDAPGLSGLHRTGQPLSPPRIEP